MNPRIYRFDPVVRLLAKALAGDPRALEHVATAPEYQEAVSANRLGPALAGRAFEVGVTGPNVEPWRDELRNSAVARVLFGEKMRQLGGVLGNAGIPWAPIKGMALTPPVYPKPEERPTSDLDILIGPADLDAAIKELTAAGWQPSAETEHELRFIRDEGYNWKATADPWILLELHFRLWGSVPEGMGERMFARAAPEPTLGTGALMLDPADSYIVAAVHVWLTPVPRYLMAWWDLHRMAAVAEPDTVAQVVDRSRREDLELFVAEAAGAAAELWGHPDNRTIHNELSATLRAPERLAGRILARSSPVSSSLGIAVLARLVSGRKSRSGWRATYRRIWAHPGTVVAETPEDWPWMRRRLVHVVRRLRSTQA